MSKKIALIPIDNRPVCYDLPKQIAGIDSDIKLLVPDRKLLGGLVKNADVEGILRWLERLEEVDAIVVSLDTIAYGGLIPSRRSKDTLFEIGLRLERIKELLKKGKKVYAFSSIMRISNNNVNEEEKEYWSEYGTQIFDYSYNFHKNGLETGDIPKEIISDYLAARHRNFSINKMYLDWAEEGIFDTLVFSKDDCAEFGLNVLESEILQRKIAEKKLLESGKTALIKTGADEIPMTLLARAVCEARAYEAPKVYPKFLAPEKTVKQELTMINKEQISNYEDISIEKSVISQIELAGCGVAHNEEESDMVLLVNNFEEIQGEIVMGVKTKGFSGGFDFPEKPFMIADVRFANGSDNKFVEKIFHKKMDFTRFFGYSAWNTSANTLGSLLCAGLVRLLASDYSQEAFKKVQLIRFLDDWAYQANVRQDLKQKSKNKSRPDVRDLQKAMVPYENKVFKLLGIKPRVKYVFPWKRFFEVEVIVR